MRARHIRSMVARAEANAPRPKGQLVVRVPDEPEWKDTDPPFMRRVYESDPAPPVLAQRMRVYDPEAARRRHEKRLGYHRKAWANRRARKAGAVVSDVDRAAIIVRDESTCYLCERRCEPEEIHLDHIVPLSRGGAHHPSNLAVACAPCNLKKSTMLTDKRPPALR